MEPSQVYSEATNQFTDDNPNNQVSNTPDDDELHRAIVKNIKDSRTHFSDWRKDAREDYDFFAGRQWTADDVAILENQQRPVVTFNRTARTINSVAGLEVQNRQEIRYYPRQLNNTGVSELLSGAAKWVRDECDAEDEESEQFQDTLICGMGWKEQRLDYETDPQGKIIEERCDPLEMGADHTSKKRNFDDSRFRYRLKTYSRGEFEERFPDAEVPKTSFFDSEEDLKQIQDLSPGGYKPLPGDDQQPSSRKLIQVAQYQYYETQKVRMVQDDVGKMVEMPEEDFQQRKAVIEAKGWQYTRQAKPKRVFYQCFLTPEKILERDKTPVNGFTFHCITGLRDRNKNTWFGIVKMMKDPQRWANKWLAQIQHILNTNAKAGKMLYETGAFKNPAKAKEDWPKPDAMIELNAGAIAGQKFYQVSAAQYPEGIDRLLQYALSAVNDVPGVNLELMGLANRDQANVLEQSRKNAGLTILAVFFDSLRRMRKESGRTLAEFIQQYISDGRLIRISGPLGQKYVNLIRDPSIVDYDVVVDDAPTSTNMKERTFGVIQSILPMILQEKIPTPPDLLDYTPLPEDLTQKWKQYIQTQSENPEVQQQKSLNQANQVAEIGYKKSQTELNTAKAQKELADIQSGAGMGELALKRQQMVEELNLKRESLAAEFNLKRDDMLMRHHVNMETGRMQADASKKPQVVQQLGSDETASNIGVQLSEALSGQAQSLAQALQMQGDAMLKGFTAIADSLRTGDEKIVEALNRPKKMTMKNSQGKNLEGEVRTVQ